MQSSATTGAPRTTAAGTTRLARFAMVLFLVAMVVFFSILEPATFFSYQNLKAILSTQACLAILGMAMVIPLVVGEFDLSAGSNLGLSGIIVTGLMHYSNLDFRLAIIVALAVSTFVGIINGLLITRIGINSLITTLGMSTFLTGVIYAYSGGEQIAEGISTNFLMLSRTRLLNLPTPVFYMAIIAIVLWYLLDQTPLGRYMYAIGGAKDAARLAGIDVQRLTLFAFALTGLVAGLAGVIVAAQLGVGDPTRGPNFLLPAFAAAFFGAAAIRPGTFNILGTIIAVFTLAVGVTGLELMGVPFWVDPMFNGLALVAAVTLTRYLRREAL